MLAWAWASASAASLILLPYPEGQQVDGRLRQRYRVCIGLRLQLFSHLFLGHEAGIHGSDSLQDDLEGHEYGHHPHNGLLSGLRHVFKLCNVLVTFVVGIQLNAGHYHACQATRSLTILTVAS